MNRYLLPFLFLSLLPSLAFAGGGFTFLGQIAHSLHIPEHVVTFLFIGSIVLAIGLLYRIKISSVEDLVIPSPKITYVNFVEGFGSFIYNLAKATMGEKQAKQYFGVVAMLFLFIFLSNSIGLIPGFLPPTDNINTTLALGTFVFIYYNVMGVKEQGLVGHIKHFMGPVWYLAPLIFIIELISHGVRPVSLALRLRGNMFGDHLVLSIFSDLAPLIVPVVFLFIGLFVCFMQAFVFTLLSMVYIGLATAHHDHDEEHAH